MNGPRPPHAPPSEPDGEGVRVVSKPRVAPRLRTWAVMAVIVAAVAALWLVIAPVPQARPDGTPLAFDSPAPAPVQGLLPSTRAAAATSTQEPPPMAGNDPDDLAAYFQPGDPEPTGAEVIGALHEAGVRTGLGAFSPPGTSPPLEGLAVPDTFQLPPGYVRHHQVTDAGVPIEPILMFSPDFNLFDAQGRRVALPASRVVPPHLAPPGLPLRRVRVDSP